MKARVVFETLDGLRFDSEEKALKHLDERYGALMTELARKLIETDCKYTKILDVLEANVGVFRTLLELQGDMKIDPEDEE